MAAVWVGAMAMFVSNHDALVITAMAAVAGVLAVRAAQLLAQGVVRDVEAMHREVDEARRRLIAAVSHDLRTPLASLRLLVESVEDGVATGETRDRYLREMRTHVRALCVLIDDLFELSRLEAGEIAWSMHQVELAELVSETVAALRAQAAERGVAVAVELPGTAPPHARSPHANAEKLQRVLFNLIVNAIRHTPADGSVVVRAPTRRTRALSRSRSPTTARASRRRSASACSSPSTAAARTARRAPPATAPASASRSRARSSRRTAAASGSSRPPRAGRACASRCRRRRRPPTGIGHRSSGRAGSRGS